MKMKRYIALFHGINISGKNTIPMTELQKGFVELGFREVKTYLNSGNVIFSSETDDIRSKSRNGFAFVNIYNVTHRGHEFYEIIQPESIWDKTKSVVSKVGVHTLGFIECTAHDIAVESAKQAVTIAMTKNTQ